MSTRSAAFCLLILVVAAAPAPADETASPARYDDFRVVRAYPESWQQIDRLHDLGARLLSCAEGLGPVDYAVPPQGMDALAALGVRHQVLVENLQASIEAEQARLHRRGRSDPRDRGWFDDYKKYEDIVAKLNAMAMDRPDLAAVLDVGPSLEGRVIKAIRIAAPGSDRPAVLLFAAQHGPEWIGPMVTMYAADALVYRYDTDPTIRWLLDRVEFFIVPVVNTDGYAYAWTNDRMWRKNRRPPPAGSSCWGVDLNRNWGFGWGGVGSSSDPCSGNYRGTAAFSEPETQALRDFISARPQIVAMVDYHAYGQLVMSPWGHTASLPPDHAALLALDQAMHDAILAVHGMQYDYGTVYSTIYPCSGISVDWGYGDRGIFAFTIELRPEGNPPGQLLPPEQIIPTAEENLPAALYLAQWSCMPLQFGFPGGLPTRVEPDTPQPVLVEISEVHGLLDPTSPRLFARVNSGAFTESTLVPLGNNQFQATLPATPCNATRQYYFTAATTAGWVVASPPDAPASVHSAQARSAETIFADDMEADHGWTVNLLGDDTATTGHWTRMDPQGTAAQPEDDHTPAPGVICWVTDGRAGSTIGEFDVDNGKTSLFSPVFDGTPGDASIGYWRWYSNDKGQAPNADVFTVDITGDGWTTWANVELVGPAGPQASGGWFYHEFGIRDILPPTATMQMRFVAADLELGSIVEAALDDFAVRALLKCPRRPGDLNCDGERNAFDIDPFVLALIDPSGYAATYPDCDLMNGDCNADGAVNVFDIDPFVALLVGP